MSDHFSALCMKELKTFKGFTLKVFDQILQTFSLTFQPHQIFREASLCGCKI